MSPGLGLARLGQGDGEAQGIGQVAGHAPGGRGDRADQIGIGLARQLEDRGDRARRSGAAVIARSGAPRRLRQPGRPVSAGAGDPR
jgi:hypothetical protein